MDLDHVVCQNKIIQMIMKKKLYLCLHGSFRFRISSCFEHFLPLQEMLFQWRSPNSTHISRHKRRSRLHKKSNCTAAICLRNIDIFYIFIKTKNVSSFIFIYKLYIILYIYKYRYVFQTLSSLFLIPLRIRSSALRGSLFVFFPCLKLLLLNCLHLNQQVM